MKIRTAWVLLAVACWGAFSGCSRRQEPVTGEAARHGAAAHAAGGETPPVASDTTAAGPSPVADSSGSYVELGAGIPVLSYVSTLVGTTPVESSLWQSKPLASFLYKALGPRIETLMLNMQETGTIQEENGVVFVLGKRKYSEDRAALAIDTATDGIYVWLLVDGKPEEYQWGDAAIPLPAGVRAVVDAAAPAP